MVEKCTVCGSKLEGRWERLTPGICRTLVKLWTRVVQTRINRVHLQRDLDLDKNEYNNAQKLRYFGLIAKDRDERGVWVITRRGGKFLHGKQSVNRQVKIYHNHIVERSDDVIDVFGVMKCDQYWPSYHDFYAYAPEPVGAETQAMLF